MRHAPEHATRHATPIAWLFPPILTSQGSDLIDDPLSAVLYASALISFFVFFWIIYEVERQLKWEGKSLFRPWKVRSPRTAARRLDVLLHVAIRALAKGKDEDEVLRMLLPLQNTVPGRARPYFNLAVERLTEAGQRDWVYDVRARDRALVEGEKALWMARAEALRAVVD